MRILVTGSSGFIGTHLSRYLASKGHEVIGIDKSEPQPFLDGALTDWPGTRVVCDILDRRRLEEVFQETRPDGVVHLAANTDIGLRHVEEYRANIDGVTNLMSALSVTPSAKICIYTSSQAVAEAGYEPVNETDYAPGTPYGESKVKTEELVRAGDGGGVAWCLVRPATVWGPGMGPTYQRFVRMVSRGRYFHVGPDHRRKPSIFVGNCAALFERVLFAEPAEIHGKTLNFGDYEPPSVREWADGFQRCLGARPIPTMPLSIARSAARVGDVIQKVIPRYPFISFRLNNVLSSYTRDTTETERICGPLPYSFEEAIAETVNWLQRIGVLDRGCVPGWPDLAAREPGRSSLTR